MPGSVRSRYERRLIALRNQLQEERHAYPLGAILVSLGAINDEQLNRALDRQRASATPRLLGELLVDLGCVKDEMLTHALSIQRAATQAHSSAPPDLLE